MAADANIFQQFLRPVRSVQDYSNDLDAAEGNKLALAAARLKGQQDQQSIADDQTSRTAAQQAGGDQNALVKALMGRGLVKQAQAIQTGMLDTEAKRGTIAKTKAETDASQYELRRKKHDQAVKDISGFQTAEQAAANLQAHIQAGDIDQVRGQSILESIPKDPAQFPQWQLGMLRNMLTAKEQFEAGTAKPTEVTTGQQKYWVDQNPSSPTFGQKIGAEPVQMVATPGEVLTDTRSREEGDKNRGVTVRGQNMGDARARDLNAIKAGEKKATEDLTNGSQLASFDTMLGTLDRLSAHPGLSKTVGLRSVLPTIPGGDSANFQAELNTFQSQAFIPMVAQLKGMGALSDAEGKKLTQAVGALDPKMGEAAFRQSIDRIKADMEAAYARVAGKPREGGATGDFGGKPQKKLDPVGKALNGYKVVDFGSLQ